MKTSFFVLLWLTVTGSLDLYVSADQCAFFTDLNHETVAVRTVNLTFKIANSCGNHNVERVWTFVKKPFGNSITCLFLLSNRICTSLSEGHARCSCDADQSTFSVSRALESENETWMLEGHVSNGRVFESEHPVWADDLPVVSTSTSTTARKETENFPTTLQNDSTSTTVFLESGFMYRVLFVVAVVVVGMLMLVVIVMCVLYRKAIRHNRQGNGRVTYHQKPQEESTEVVSIASARRQSRDAEPEVDACDSQQEILEAGWQKVRL